MRWGGEGQALALRNIKKRHPTVVRGPVPRNAWPPCCRCTNRFFAQHLFRSFRTLMSIEKRMEAVFKVREDLNNERRA